MDRMSRYIVHFGDGSLLRRMTLLGGVRGTYPSMIYVKFHCRRDSLTSTPCEPA
jgi:hypothetical protein